MTISNDARIASYTTTFSYCTGIFSVESALKKDVGMAVSAGVIQAATIAGYIPGVSTIVGIARIIFACVTLKERNQAADREALIVRGSIEILSVAGPLLALADIIGTIFLLVSSFKQNSSKEHSDCDSDCDRPIDVNDIERLHLVDENQ